MGEPINPLDQIEAAWGTPRSSWSLDEWKRAAETTSKALSMTLVLMESQGGIINALIRPALPKKRGRRPKPKPMEVVRGLLPIKVKQPASLRHTNFGSKKAIATTENNLVLVAAVELEKARGASTDKEALSIILKRIKPRQRQGLIDTEVQNKLAPQLSNARKEISATPLADAILQWVKDQITN